MPQVSVIVPNYNHARFLPRRLESILGQTFRDLELIFLDDASTDDSLLVFEPYADDPRVRSSFNSTNSGSPFIQWNRGLQMARGEYIWIAESDDFCEPQFLERLVPKLDENPKAALAYSQSWIVDEEGRKTKVLDWYHVFGGGERWSKDFRNSGVDEITRFLAIQNTIPNASAVLFRTAAIDESGPAPEDMKICGDWLFWVNMLINSQLEFVAEPLNCFRQVLPQSQRNVTSREGLEVIESLKIQRKVLDEIKPDRVHARRMLNHHLRRWASLSAHEGLSRDFDDAAYQGFKATYDGTPLLGLVDRSRIGFYHAVMLPVMKSTAYRHTVGHWRTLYLQGKGEV